MVWQFAEKNLSSVPVCWEGGAEGWWNTLRLILAATSWRFGLNSFVGFNLQHVQLFGKHRKAQTSGEALPCLPAAALEPLLLCCSPLCSSTLTGESCAFMHINFCIVLNVGEKHPKCLGLFGLGWFFGLGFFKIIIPYNLLSQPGSLLLTGNADLKEAVLELKKPGRKEKTMAWIKIIPLDRNG